MLKIILKLHNKQVLRQRFGNDPISPRLKAYLAEFEQAVLNKVIT